MEYKMQLTDEQLAILNGSKGEEMAKVMKTLVQYGETYGAKRMIPVTSEYGHLVTSFGIGVMKPVFDLMDKLISAGCVSGQKFSVDPRPLDYKNVKVNPIQKLIFNKIMYSAQTRYEGQLQKMGLMSDDAFTCACYFDEIGNTPKKGDVLSWAESSAVVYANSVLGARCNRNSGIIELFGSIAGFVPDFGFTTDEGRKATWIVEIKTTQKPVAQLLGSAIGMKVMEEVPYVVGLDKWLGNELTDEVKDYLKDFGAATASNGAVGLYHIDGLTPEAVEQGRSLVKEDAKVYVIDDAELKRVYDNYPVIWKNKDAKPSLAFIGCPHLSLSQIKDWTHVLEKELKAAGNDKVQIRTVMTCPPAVEAKFKESPEYGKLISMGVKVSNICPLMYMNNPLCAKAPVITCSNKLRTYTTARYYNPDELAKYVATGKEVR